MIKIDRIREIGDFVYKPHKVSQESCGDPWRLSHERELFKCFAKGLEESPDNTHLLDTINLSSLMPTIRSRCRADCKINKGYLTDWLPLNTGFP